MAAATTDAPPGCEFDPKAHVYRIGGEVADSVTQVIWENGLIDTAWYTEEARARGLFVHAACHYLDENDLDWSTVPDGFKGYIRSWEAFKARTGLEVQSVEAQVWDLAYRNAGTLDRRVKMHGSLWILDLKTVGSGKGSPPPWTRYQTAAYEKMDRNAHGGPERRRGAIVLQEDGSLPKLVEYSDGGDYYDFLAMSQATKVRRRHNRGRKRDGD